ncbi:MAG: tetratricopeptide repeat protein, partial [Deltaproteobacteria bacterium]|nr:tetratricopeptide repeat protein [Deltaproteobacteria bacterium]
MKTHGIGLAMLLLTAAVDASSAPLHDALLAMANGETDSAIAQLDRIAARGGTDAATAVLLKGRAQFVAGRHEACAKTYRALLQQVAPQSPAGIKAQFGLAECDAVAGRFREAEQRFSAALEQLTSAQRRDEMVRRFVKLGDGLLAPNDVGASPDPRRAEKIYRAALDLGAEGALRDEVALKIGRSMARQKRHSEAGQFLVEYVEKTPEVTRQPDFWYRAGRYFVTGGQGAQARRLLRDLLAGYPRSPLAPKASYWIARSFGIPEPKDGAALARGTAALEDYVRRFPKDKRVEKARLEVVQAAMHLKRYGQAEQALRTYLAAGGPEENVARARFLLGECLAKQGRWREAARGWLDYLKRHAAHGSWLQAQQGIEEMAFAEAEAMLKSRKWADAAKVCRRYAEKYPAAARAPRALLEAGRAEAEQGHHQQALEVLRTLTAKFPQTPEAADGWCEIGRLREERDRDVAQARAAYRKALAIDAGHARATQRLDDLERPSLVVDRPHTTRVGQKPVLTWYARNLEQVDVRIYRVDAADYFRDHRDLEGLADLDIALCTPDRSLTVPVAGYRKHLRIEQKVTLPIAEPGLYLVSLGGNNLEV